MTVVPAPYGRGVQLICDVCGDAAITDSCGLHDADVVFVAVDAVGWSGSAFARGPHRCGRCSRDTPAGRHSSLRPGPGRRRLVDGVVLERVDIERTPYMTFVRVTGDIDLDVTPDLDAALESAVSVAPYVVVDLSGAGIIDSAGLGALVRGRNAARRRQGELLLAGPSRFVQTVLRTMRLHTAFRVFTTVEQAAGAVRAPGQWSRHDVAGRGPKRRWEC